MIDFSLILPSRERTHLLKGLLASISKATADTSRIECLVAVDADDSESVNASEGLKNQYPWLTVVVGERQDNFSDGYYNRLANLSTGRYVQALNDDVEFVTPHWDRIAITVLKDYQERHPDGILYGFPADSGYGYACFPLLSRQAVDAMTWFFHPEFSCWGADIHLHEIYSLAERVLHLPYKLNHAQQNDAVHQRLGAISHYNFGSAAGESLRLKSHLSTSTSFTPK